MRSAIMDSGERGMSEVAKDQIQIKGIREGLLISLGDGSFQDAQLALLGQINRQTSFFRALAWHWTPAVC